MQLVELGPLTQEDWDTLVAGEHDPFGPIGAGLRWRDKELNLALRDERGQLIAAAGAVLAEVRIAGGRPLRVVGLGGVIVTSTARGRGLMAQLMDPLLRRAEELGPALGMLFCREGLVPLYERFDFAVVDAPVWADQAQGRIEMPLVAMWGALHPGAHWPAGGPVEVLGLPF